MSTFNFNKIIDSPTRVTTTTSTVLNPVFISDTVDEFSSKLITELFLLLLMFHS